MDHPWGPPSGHRWTPLGHWSKAGQTVHSGVKACLNRQEHGQSVSSGRLVRFGQLWSKGPNLGISGYLAATLGYPSGTCSTAARWVYIRPHGAGARLMYHCSTSRTDTFKGTGGHGGVDHGGPVSPGCTGSVHQGNPHTSGTVLRYSTSRTAVSLFYGAVTDSPNCLGLTV